MHSALWRCMLSRRNMEDRFWTEYPVLEASSGKKMPFGNSSSRKLMRGPVFFAGHCLGLALFIIFLGVIVIVLRYGV